MIELQQISRVYHRGADEVHALENVSLRIPDGTFVALMGPSGSGKSTLLNLIAGLDQPSVGTIKVGDQVLSGLSEDQLAAWRAAHVGFVFQFYNLIPVLSALENVEVPLLLTRLAKTERRKHAELALSIVGLADRKNHLPNQLSGGEQQRVAIARAIVVDPALIVADEPTGDLDAKNADDILALLRQLKQEFHKTVIMVTHDSRATRYVDQIFHLDKGILVDGAAVTEAEASR
ncbi:MAG TPA: ABC transporter ATP-binding protein [Candidatus Binatia bacterium]|jgi:putative ABC transport system ATP-binding protein|nr:ABC transporter ATP-binding protein [Candidatus Binatia bacterium]